MMNHGNDAGLIALLGMDFWQRMPEQVKARMRILYSRRMANSPEYSHLKPRQKT